LLFVRGNNDRGGGARALAETEVVERGGRALYVLHDLHELDLDPRAAGFDAVIVGHSHVRASSRRDGVPLSDRAARSAALPAPRLRGAPRGPNAHGLEAEILTPMSDLAAPLDRYRDVVRPEWIDHNQHNDMGYYLVVFDYATTSSSPGVGSNAAPCRARAHHLLPGGARDLPP